MKGVPILMEDAFASGHFSGALRFLTLSWSETNIRLRPGNYQYHLSESC
ncbi:hypothetical protein Krac_7521 [Ktedonobacter racemifer DSM 44963]|uniref:Uncharacterized protein n=1 Tax=Ktedonobacter racemifer DSM 44963 TaxID=485913 RepID=D6TKD0_KTERA|nr:hypothetical protein Krac_7521 [Ktedonobacter racemifer DSM 44963]